MSETPDEFMIIARWPGSPQVQAIGPVNGREVAARVCIEAEAAGWVTYSMATAISLADWRTAMATQIAPEHRKDAQ